MTEREIIIGCQKGEASHQKILVERYSPMLMTVCRQYARDNESAKDVLQDSLIKVFRHIHKYQFTGSFQAWLRRICINTALQTFDKNCFKNEIHGLDALQVQPSSMPDVYSYLAAEELIEIIDALPDGFRQVFNLYVIENFSHKEIAVLLGITESTSRSQLVRARSYLRKMLVERDRIRV